MIVKHTTGGSFNVVGLSYADLEDMYASIRLAYDVEQWSSDWLSRFDALRDALRTDDEKSAHRQVDKQTEIVF